MTTGEDESSPAHTDTKKKGGIATLIEKLLTANIAVEKKFLDAYAKLTGFTGFRHFEKIYVGESTELFDA